MKKLLLAVLGLGLSLGLVAQRVIEGTISDESGMPLIGASVLAKGTSTGTVSDIDGNFTLTVADEVTELVVSYTGFATRNITLDGSTTLEIILSEDAAQLSEVVVVGYGKQIRSTLTGNVAQIDGAAIENLPVSSVEQAMQGRSAGVFVQAVSGKPGGRINIRVRGSSSISAGNQPLYVVDGVPITSGTFSSPGSGSQNFLADLNPNDVESIEILKDASAAAIYGSRAANGVVLVTTKQGKSGKARINVNLSTGASEPSRLREFMDAEEFVSFFRQTAEGGARYDWANQLDEFGLGSDYTLENTIAAYTDFVEGRFDRYSGPSDWRNNETNTDWQEEAFQTGRNQNADLSLSGGSEKLAYYASFGYSDQEGILAGNGFQRLSTRLNLDAEASDRFTYGMRLGFSRSDNERVSNDNQFSTPLQLIALAPITPVRNTTDEVYQGYAPGQLFDRPVTTYYNGLVELANSEKQSVSYRTLGNVFGQFDITKGLSARAEAGVDVANIKQNRFLGRLTDGGEATNGFADSRWSSIVNYTTKALLLYNREFAAGHNVDFVGGVEFQQSTSEDLEVDAQEFPLDQLRTIASAADITGGSSTLTEFTFLSYFGRANYNFDRKYLFSLSARMDGSSRFGANNRYGFFPAVAAGWVLSEEDFLQDNGVFSYLKLRSSYGLTGNADISNFASLGLYGASGYGGVSGLAPVQIPNPDLTWESTKQFDVGIDFGVFNNRLSGELDYYVKNTNDLLLNVPVPGTSGFRSQFRNLGELRNRGVELLLNAVVSDAAFGWNTSFNFSYNQNEILSLAPGQDIIDDGGSRYMNVVKVGESLGAFYGLEYAGVDPANGDGLFYVNARDDEGNIIDPEATTNNANEANFVMLGDALPTTLAGWTNNFSYKGLTLDVFFQGSFGNEVHNSAGVFQSCGGCWFDNQTRDQLDAWTPENTDTDVPEARFFWGNADNGRSSRYLSSGDFIRLKTVTLGYELPANLVDRIGLNRLRFYVTGQNLALITDYAGWDPEVAADFLSDSSPNILTSVDFYTAPQPRTIIVGLNVGL
ncbi:TonB-linked SusC/RagA family outer membrane protein [Lewinella marina]|uniref:SusC/RagA family TonB-linked outer membrane protein n=1 Tax=Neolewinella marina TaxID=438751 RepID=A0A2G0CDX6_9BACT|nr:TonB-dependent receptor [Neolewinella marina]NJB87522.1 TonB-linked SusC/RagA family outer membrane protein [Neolewinella marina]PHK98172.1 SusC/RagA family TonB-linked outer membrane protein [Neolewinella marina]